MPVWGTAGDGERVTVRFQNQKVSTVASNGRWMVHLKPLKAGGPFDISIAGENTVEVHNVSVGEVWLCGGQSNMAWPVKMSAEAEEVIADCNDPMLREYFVPNDPKYYCSVPASDVSGYWAESSPKTVGDFSAVSYHFGKELRNALNVPIGLINAPMWDTPAEAWTSRETLEADPDLKPILGYPGPFRVERHRPCVMYNSMIAPLCPFPIRGVIWYQGENNAGRAFQYRKLFPALIRNWRADWGEGDFPFLFVQLAPFQNFASDKPEDDVKIPDQPSESSLAELREAQLLTSLHVPNTAMVVITDYGRKNDNHPLRKKPVGVRLALAARAKAYREKLVFSGPDYTSMKIRKDRAVLTFNNLGSGLDVHGDKLTGFTIAGDDKLFHKATAEVVGKTVVVWSTEVPHPAAVRYGWADYPIVDLFNKEGLPASPFRTDDFPMTTRSHQLPGD